MSSDDVLRSRLASLDPMAGRPVTPLTDALKEHAMTAPSPSRNRTPLLAGAAAAVLVAGTIGALIVTEDRTPGASHPPVATGKKTVLQLTAPPSTSMGMCVRLDASILRNAVHAFEGRATSVEGGTTSFDVTHWYKGGSEQVVTLTSEATVEDGTTFEAGKTYLVAADETAVGPCSGSGEENADLKKLFEDAFATK